MRVRASGTCRRRRRIRWTHKVARSWRRALSPRVPRDGNANRPRQDAFHHSHGVHINGPHSGCNCHDTANRPIQATYRAHGRYCRRNARRGKRVWRCVGADPSVDYASGKIISKDGVRGFQPDPYPIGLNARVRAVLHKYRGTHPLFASIRDGWTGAVPPSANRLHLGPLGAADQVIDDAERIVEIQQYWRKLIGIEMETYVCTALVMRHPSRNHGLFHLRRYAISRPKSLTRGKPTPLLWLRISH